MSDTQVFVCSVVISGRLHGVGDSTEGRGLHGAFTVAFTTSGIRRRFDGGVQVYPGLKVGGDGVRRRGFDGGVQVYPGLKVGSIICNSGRI